MESVEQLCDNIALINKSQVVLTGKVSDIKKSHSTNTFHIECSGIKKDEILDIKAGEVKNIIDSQEIISFDVTLNENIKGNDLLSEIMSKNGNIIKYTEVLPSMNEIFIKTVNKQ